MKILRTDTHIYSLENVLEAYSTPDGVHIYYTSGKITFVQCKDRERRADILNLIEKILEE